MLHNTYSFRPPNHWANINGKFGKNTIILSTWTNTVSDKIQVNIIPGKGLITSEHL